MPPDRRCVFGRISHDGNQKTPTKTLLRPNSRAVGSIAPTMISLIQAIPTVAADSNNAAWRTEAGDFSFLRHVGARKEIGMGDQ